MNDYGGDTYGENISEVYDQLYSEYDEHCIQTLAELAEGGPVLELGIGTGRIALPLQETGVEVHGIDASPGMLEKLQAKPGGKDVPITLGDFGKLAVEGHFSLIYVVFNTFYNLLTQEDQIGCFRSVSEHLLSGGVFVMEVFVPDLGRFDRGQTFRVVRMGENKVQLEATQHDAVKQRVNSYHIHLTQEGARFYPVKLRYSWPSELDLMARLAGMELLHRWGDWDKREFTADSGKHISVYGKAQ